MARTLLPLSAPAGSLKAVINRYLLACNGCGENFFARLGLEPTGGTQFYFPCPECQLPITGTINGQELHELRVIFDAEELPFKDDQPQLKVVTVNPFVPSSYEADSHSPVGAFPTMTLMRLLGYESFMEFGSDRGQAAAAIEELWPTVRMLFRYYQQDNRLMFLKTATEKLGFDWEPSTAHERTSVAYQALGTVTTAMIGPTGNHSVKIMDRFAKKYGAATKHKAHLLAMRERGSLAATLERDVFTELGRFVDTYEAWEMGRLSRFVDAETKPELDALVLYRNEFSVVSRLYQQGFELACKCLWPLVAAQNSVKRGDPNDFGDVHPPVDVMPVKSRPKNLGQFDKLPSARKIAYVVQVPGWESFSDVLDNKLRNTIGHATAHHDLQTGRIVSDVDPVGVTYLDFLGMTFDLFEALAVLTQVLRAARVASSPDFLRVSRVEAG